MQKLRYGFAWTLLLLAASSPSRLFRRFAGAPPYHYLVRRRMEAATARLAHPGSPVKEVAAEFGFADRTTFPAR